MGYISGSAVFAEKNIKSIKLPSTLEYIGDFAFRENALANISIPNGVAYIGRDAFYSNDIDSVFIPNTVRTIEPNAFHSNANLDTVVFEGASHLIKIGSHAFVYTSVTTIKLPTPVVPDNNFEYWIQFDNDRTHYQGGAVVTPDYYEFLAKYDYTLRDDDVEVVNGVIESCSYNFDSKFIIIPNELDGQTITGIAGSSSQKGAVFYGKTLLELTLPSTLETIGQFSFNSNSIDTLIIPNSVKSIEDYAFWGFSLDTVIFESNSRISKIGYAAFDNNSNLKMYFPAPVKDNYEFINWKDEDGNTFAGGEQVTEFEASYSANFSLLPGNPEIALSGNLSFGNVKEQASSTTNLTISNSGNATLTVSSLSLPDGFSANWTKGDIAVDVNREVEITFLPTEVKSYSGYIKVICNASSGVDSILVEGNGIAAPVISLSEDITFTDIKVGAEATGKLTISNTGSAELKVNNIDLPSGFTANWKSGLIAVGNKQDVTITFAPKEVKAYQGVVTINSNAGVSSLNISGTVVGTPIISLFGDLHFGEVEINGSLNKILQLNNSGSELLKVTNIQLPEGFSANPANCDIEAGNSKQVTITFSPEKTSLYSGEITVISNAGDANNTISVSGTGIKGSTSINEVSEKRMIIYPNPVSDILVVQSIDGNQAIKKLEILTTTGQKVLEPTTGNQIDLSGLVTGNYLVKIVTDKQVFVEQVVKK